MKAYEKSLAKRTKKGFTLIELLVVIAIIAVLLAILMPAMRKIKEIARETACKSNLKNIGLAVAMYLDDYERKLPPRLSSNGFLWFESDGVTYRKAGSGGGTYWGTWYKEYLKETKIFGCPSFQSTTNTRLIYTYSGNAKNSDSSYLIQHAAFGLNSHPRARHRNTNDIYRHDEFIFCSDHAEPRPECGTSDGFHNNDRPGAMNLTSYRRGGSRHFSYRQIFRHNIRYADDERTGGRANILWLDGHVTALEETTGDDVPSRWYTGDKPELR
jgi:prepilin-type N-terminal cleavage/methylation domain-containing protein/prepilin-type processing-associated H-X9-DG protein